MHVRAPFAYSVDYYKHDGRKLVQRTLVDHVEGDVSEMSEAEAPVALRWEMRPSIGNSYHRYVVRYHGGKFYAKAGRHFLDGYHTDLSAEVLVHPDTTAGAADLFAGETFGRFNHAINEHLKGKNQRRPAAKDVETDLGDDLDERRLAAERRLAGMAVIDGNVWTEIHEPTLYLRADTGLSADTETQKGVFLKEPRLGTLGYPPGASAYRIDQTDLWHRVGTPTGRETIKERARDIVIEMPEVFVFDAVENAMLRTVEAFVDLIGPEAHGLHRSAVGAYLDIRDKFRGYVDDRTSLDIADLLEETVSVMKDIRGRTEAYRIVSRACAYATTLEPSISLDIGIGRS